MNLLISGANGFVGKSLSQTLVSNGHKVTQLQRDNFLPDAYGNDGYQCLIHLAGRAHVIRETVTDIYTAYREVNLDYTVKVASLAHSLRIKRFIFLSSVKVNGEYSNHPFNDQDVPSPLDAYGQTKLEAELFLKDFCLRHDMELVIIRPPLIYGPDVKANFKALIHLCNQPIPLPFSCVHNKRSMISLKNLNSFITLCCQHPEAANQTFLISDDHDVSINELIKTIRYALGRKPLLFPMPVSLLKAFFKVVGKDHLNDRLLNNLQVDSTKAKRILNWQPDISFAEGIKITIDKIVLKKNH